MKLSFREFLLFRGGWAAVCLFTLVASPYVYGASRPPDKQGDLLVKEENDGLDLSVHGEILSRYENWDWFGRHDDDYDFGFIRTRLKMRALWKDWELYLEPQFVKMQNLPEHAVLPPPRGPSGMGGLYFAHNGEDSPWSMGFHQAYLQYTHPSLWPLRLKAGRFTYASGLEYMNPADGEKFNALKTMRLGDRMISSFEWSAFARSFDGVRVDLLANDRLSLTATYMYPTQGGWEEDFNDTIHDVRINTLAATFPKDSLIPGGECGLFAYNYHDGRDCTQRIDNTVPGVPGSCDKADLDLHMLGGHAVGLVPTENGQWDYLLWGGVQNGDWYEQDHSAYGGTLEGGYQWTQVPWKPWVRLGYFLGSGDSDPGDGDHETFFQMAPGTRKYQLFPYYDLQNCESKFLQLFLFPRKDLKLRLDYSLNRLAEDNDRWYMGTGPTQQRGDIFGYLGRPSGGDDQLSREASIMLTYKPREHLSFNAFYSHVWGGEVIRNVYPDDGDADYFSVGMTLTF